MPVMSGFESTEEIRKFVSAEELPIVAVSAGTIPTDIERARRVGMQGYYGKPVGKKELEVLVRIHTSERVLLGG